MIVRIERNIPLAPLTSFKIGGVADYFCSVQDEEELRGALAFAREKSLPVFILGGGTNLLVSDAGFQGLVVKMENKGHRVFEAPQHSVSVVAEAGEPWDTLVSYAVEQGLWGIENLSGIPGTVGGAPVQNIGAYGVELKEVLEWVETIDARTGAARRFSCAECRFGYRDSFFKTAEGTNFIIMRVAFRLQKDGTPNLFYKDLAEYFKNKKTPTLSEVRRAVLEIRARKFPDLARYGTAGSFFKNPIIPHAQYEKLKERYPDLPGFELPITIQSPPTIKIPLAWILDKVCNLKGYERGNAALWENQPLVLVNRGGASAREVRALAEEVAAKVREVTGLVLEWEVQKV